MTEKTKILYEKIGRRYVPVSQAALHDYELRPANGFMLTYIKDGLTMWAYDVQPDTAGFRAAALVAKNAMEKAINEAAKMQPSGGRKPYTAKQRKLIEQFTADMGGMMPLYWEGRTSYQIAQAGIDAVTAQTKV